MHDLLHGLTLLHGVGVVHRVCQHRLIIFRPPNLITFPQDISEANILVNHFQADPDDAHMRKDLRRKALLRYALIDYDCSLLIPPGPTTSVKNCRIDYRASYYGTFLRPADTAQGEYCYNPFAFDVASLGILFCNRFQVRINYYDLIYRL